MHTDVARMANPQPICIWWAALRSYIAQYLDDEKENRAITFVFCETVQQTSEESLDQVPEFKSGIRKQIFGLVSCKTRWRIGVHVISTLQSTSQISQGSLFHCTDF